MISSCLGSVGSSLKAGNLRTNFVQLCQHILRGSALSKRFAIERFRDGRVGSELYLNRLQIVAEGQQVIAPSLAELDDWIASVGLDQASQPVRERKPVSLDVHGPTISVATFSQAAQLIHPLPMFGKFCGGLSLVASQRPQARKRYHNASQ